MGCAMAMSPTSSCRMARSLPSFRTPPATGGAGTTPIPTRMAACRHSWERATRCPMTRRRSIRSKISTTRSSSPAWTEAFGPLPPIWLRASARHAKKTRKAPAQIGAGAFFCHAAMGLERSVVQNKSHGQIDLEFGDLAILDHHVLVLDPGALDPAQCLRGAFDALFGRIVKAVGRCCGDFRYTCYRHGVLLSGADIGSTHRRETRSRIRAAPTRREPRGRKYGQLSEQPGIRNQPRSPARVRW